MTTGMLTALPTIKFGTDGWRAVIADEFTFAAVERVAQAYADQMKGAVDKPVITVGYDNRFQSDAFARRVCEVLAANSIGVEMFSQPVPTPLVSFAVVRQKRSGGIVITASHNAPHYNGFKIKESWGGSAFETLTRQVESLVDETPVSYSERTPVPSVDSAITQDYFGQLAGLVEVDRIKSAGLNVVVDSMHGTGGTITESLTTGGATRVQTIRHNRDCLFGGIAPEPIDQNLAALKAAVKANHAVIGLATDGDADRIGAVNEHGQTMTMHQVAPILLNHLVKAKRLSGTVVATVTQSVLMRRLANALGLPFKETPVGFKYIAEEILSSDVLIGAEESGGIGIKGHIPERDGILNGLLLLEALAVENKKPTEIVSAIHKEFGHFYYDRMDLHVPLSKSQSFLTHLAQHGPSSIGGDRVVDIILLDGVKFMLQDDSWLMFRRSGTEPLLRIYSEATSEQKTAKLLSAAQDLLQAMG